MLSTGVFGMKDQAKIHSVKSTVEKNVSLVDITDKIQCESVNFLLINILSEHDIDQWFSTFLSMGPVSYTHLDVYKRQT